MSSTRKSAARPINSRCASVNQNRKIMADDDYVYDEASGEWLPASDIAARDAAEAAAPDVRDAVGNLLADGDSVRSEEHTSELQSLMRTSYAVFCLKKKHIKQHT